MKVSVELYGMEGEGRNVTEAKKDAGRKIESALAGSYTPEILTWRGCATLVWREPDGWRSRVIADPEGGVREGRVWGGCGTDRESVVRSALLNLAQIGWQHVDGDEIPPFLTDRESVREFLLWVAFQMAVWHARKLGIEESQIHRWACDHSREFLATAS